MANGQVTTGFSSPKIALYTESSGTVSYSGLMVLARGVNVSIAPETSDDNNFYADNVLAESDAGRFTGGELTLEVDGLLDAARKTLMGLPTATTASVSGETVSIYHYDDDQAIPYVGVGFVTRVQSGGVVSYIPTVLKKVKFELPELSAATQEEDIDWQTESLTGHIMRDDSAKHEWRLVGGAVTSEAIAIAVVDSLLS